MNLFLNMCILQNNKVSGKDIVIAAITYSSNDTRVETLEFKVVSSFGKPTKKTAGHDK